MRLRKWTAGKRQCIQEHCAKAKQTKHTGPSLLPGIAFFSCSERISSMRAQSSSLVCNHKFCIQRLSTIYVFGRRRTQPLQLQIHQPDVISVPFFWPVSALWVKLQGLVLKPRACGRHNHHVHSRNGSKTRSQRVGPSWCQGTCIKSSTRIGPGTLKIVH